MQELKPVTDVKTISHDCKPKLGSEQQKSALKPRAEQDRYVAAEEQKTAAPPPKATQVAHDVSAAVQKAGAAKPKLSEPERKAVIAAHQIGGPVGNFGTGAQHPGPLKHEMASPAASMQRLPPIKDTSTASRKEPAISTQQVEEHAPKVAGEMQHTSTPAEEAPVLPFAAPATTPSHAEQAILAVSNVHAESPKAAIADKGRADIASADSTPRAPELERSHACGGVDQQPVIHGEQAEPEAAVDGSKHETEDGINDVGAAATPAAQMKVFLYAGPTSTCWLCRMRISRWCTDRQDPC